jgi:hypothetical protein
MGAPDQRNAAAFGGRRVTAMKPPKYAASIGYPTLLDFPATQLKSYPRETVAAEKFHAMVLLGIVNSRMKYFFDVRTRAN